jgi:hypothetical protein
LLYPSHLGDDMTIIEEVEVEVKVSPDLDQKQEQ